MLNCRGPSISRSSLNLKHQCGHRKPRHTEQRHGRRGTDGPESGTEQVEVLHGFVHICGVSAQANDVGKAHFCSGPTASAACMASTAQGCISVLKSEALSEAV